MGAVVADPQLSLGSDLLVQQARGVGNPREDARVGVQLPDRLDGVAARHLLEHVEHELEGVELVLDRGVGLGEPADGRAECPANRLNLPLLADLVEGLQDVRRDLVDVGVVQHEHVDVVHLQAVERAVERGMNPLGVDALGELAVAGLWVVVEVVAELRGDGDLVADLAEGLTDELLGVAVAVHVAGVKECDALFDGVADHVDGLLSGAVAPPVRADDPCTEADLADLDAGGTEFAVLHDCLLARGPLSGCDSGGA